MPIYEYYCGECGGRFRHLARYIDAAAPACPRCGQRDVERLISAANLVRGASDHQAALCREASQVNREDLKAVARFLEASGRLEDASGLYGSPAYRELITRRMEGANDRELGDLVDDLVAACDASEATQAASALVLSEQVGNRLGAQGPPEDHDPDRPISESRADLDSRFDARRRSDDLGWG